MLRYHIQTIQVGSGGASNITFNNIPQNYDDLYVVLSARSTISANTTYVSLKFNGSTSSYSGRTMIGTGDGNLYSGTTSTTQGDVGEISGNTATANTFGSTSLVIPNYTSSNFKSFSADSTGESNTARMYTGMMSGLWSNTTAINSISLVEGQGNNFVQYSSASLYGIKRGSDGKTQVASGGTITTSGGYTIHTFNASGTFVANSNLTVEALVIGGGGGGGDDVGGGGGAGGYRTIEGLALTSSTSYPIIVGSGGSRGTYAAATPGGSSSFAGITSAGGGKSAGYANSGGPGGSGGGGGSGGAAGAGNTPATSPSQGNNGANGEAINGSGGGGGGASAAASGRNGGAGTASSITGTSVTRGGGGASGGTTSGGGQGTGGAGGGGNGGAPGQAGTANTGGGGGGGNVNAQAGNGGSGVVIIRYLTAA